MTVKHHPPVGVRETWHTRRFHRQSFNQVVNGGRRPERQRRSRPRCSCAKVTCCRVTQRQADWRGLAVEGARPSDDASPQLPVAVLARFIVIRTFLGMGCREVTLMAGWSVQWLARPSPPKTCLQLDLNLLLFPPHSLPLQTRQTPPSWLTGTNVSLLDCILICSNAHSQSLLQARVAQLDFGDHLQGSHAHYLGAVRRRLRLLHRSLSSRWPHDP